MNKNKISSCLVQVVFQIDFDKYAIGANIVDILKSILKKIIPVKTREKIRKIKNEI